MSKPINVNDSSFEKEVLQADKPVLVDFWAEWCGPCKQIAPFIEDIAKKKSSQLKVAKFDIDDNPNIPTRYAIKGIPTLLIFTDGHLQATKVGSLPPGQLLKWVEETLAAST